MRRIACLTGLAFCALTFPCAAQSPDEPPLVLDASVQETIVALLKDYRPAASIASIAQVTEINAQGRRISMRGQASYARQDNGLWTAYGGGGASDGSSSGSGSSVSLCGLVILLRLSASQSTLDMAGAAPIGHQFVPFGIRSTRDYNTWRKVTKLATSATNLCTPSPGATFSFHEDVEASFKSSGLFGQNRHITGTNETSCKAADSARPARDLGLPFRGDALLVDCLSVPSPGNKQKLHYAFLNDIGFYVLMSQGDPGDPVTAQMRYEAVQYAQ